jgi:murein DD-endopeptidase MepM/ murein hydrolase activator NlpD
LSVDRFGMAAIVRKLAYTALAVGAGFAALPARAEEPAFDGAFGSLFGDGQASATGEAPVPVRPVTYNRRLRTDAGTPAVPHVSAGSWQAGKPGEYAAGAHITVSRAADALGAAVDFTRPIGMRPKTGTGSGSPITVSLPSGMPVSARTMTSSFGMRRHPMLGGHRMHSGIDLAAPTGSPIVATSDGVVSAAGWNGGLGLAVALEHGGGLQTRFGHMSQLAVVPGQQVRRGQVIGYVGSTGRSTGPHLHYEMRVNGRAVNPISSNRK